MNAALRPDSPLPRWRRAAVLVRVVHPFPSLLDAVVAAAIAHLAGASADVTGRLGLAMLLLQFSIGAANDVADADRDAAAERARAGDPGRVPAKPVAAGWISPTATLRLSLVLAACGLVLAGSVGAGPLLIAVLGLADGLLYDLRLKGTPWSWLPFAVGVALIPVYAWWGATGSLAPFLSLVFVLAVAAGASLAIANAVCDVGPDSEAGVRSAATSLGRGRALAANAVLLAAVHLVLLATVLSGRWPGLAAGAAMLLGSAVGWTGFVLTVRPPRRRQLGWELQAAGLGVAAVGWIGLLVATGALLPRA